MLDAAVMITYETISIAGVAVSIGLVAGIAAVACVSLQP